MKQIVLILMILVALTSCRKTDPEKSKEPVAPQSTPATVSYDDTANLTPKPIEQNAVDTSSAIKETVEKEKSTLQSKPGAQITKEDIPEEHRTETKAELAKKKAAIDAEITEHNRKKDSTIAEHNRKKAETVAAHEQAKTETVAKHETEKREAFGAVEEEQKSVEKAVLKESSEKQQTLEKEKAAAVKKMQEAAEAQEGSKLKGSKSAFDELDEELGF